VWRVVSPAAELDIDEPLVRSLLAEQHPDLADLPLVELDAGWDNTLWRVGPELLVRLPRRAVAAALTIHEQRWLPTFAASLPLPVPVPIRIGRPSDRYPWAWSVVPWFDGTPGDRVATIASVTVAEQLGGFLRALHRPAPADAPRNPYRGVPLVERRDAFDARLRELADEIDAPSVRTVWERACAAPRWTGEPTWLHGDLHPANLLFVAGTLSAVIDFGDVCAGDPASDLAAAWMLLPADAMPAFARSYGGIDAHLETRARGWTVLLGLMLLAIGLDDRPTYAPIGRRALARAIAGPDGPSEPPG
jgi:aminoglycoside phosphotransferase (APT) family kinase protein